MGERNSGFGDFLTGILVGGAIGYVLALLNAPRPGDETRQMLTERSRELRDQAMDTVQATVDKTGKLVSEGRDRLGTTVETTRNRVQTRVSDLKGRGEEVVTDAREKVSDNLRKAADSVEPSGTQTTMGTTDTEI
jgi:gas vesicle protein